MDRDERGGSPSRINRREALKRAAAVTGVAWAAPVLTSLRTPAFAQYGPCEENCAYVAVITQRNGTFSCSECPQSPPPRPGCALCGEQTCAGPACARVTSITDEGTHVRVCFDCDVHGGATFCHRCLDTGECTCSGDPAFEPGEKCVRLMRFFDCAGDEDLSVFFTCQAC